MTINVQVIKTAVQSMGNAPTQAQLASLVSYVPQLEAVYVELRKAIAAQRLRDWDFTVDVSAAETRPYIQSELTAINAKSKANTKDRAYLTAFRAYIETVYTTILTLLDLFREGTYVPNGIDGVGLLDKLYSFVVAQGASFKFTDATVTDTACDASKLAAIKAASTGTVTTPSCNEVTGSQAAIETFLGSKSADFGNPVISITAPTGATTATSLQSIKQGMDGTPKEIKLDNATTLVGTEVEINAIYTEPEFTGEGTLTLAPTGAVTSAAQLVNYARTSGKIDLGAVTTLNGTLSDTLLLLQGSRTINKDANTYVLSDTGAIAGTDLKAVVDVVDPSNGTVTTSSSVEINATLSEANSIAGDPGYGSRATSTYKLSDTGNVSGSDVKILLDRITVSGSSGSMSGPNLGKINSSLAEASYFTTSSANFTDSKEKVYAIDEVGQDLAGSSLISILGALTNSGALEMVGTAGTQRIIDSAPDLNILFNHARISPNLVRAKANDSTANAPDLLAVMAKMPAQQSAGSAVQTLELTGSDVHGSLSDATLLVGNTKFANAKAKNYTDNTSGSLTADSIRTLTTPSDFVGSFSAPNAEISCDTVSTAQTLLGDAKFASRAGNSYTVSAASAIPSNLYASGAANGLTSASSLNATLNSMSAAGRLNTPQMAVFGEYADVNTLANNGKYLSSGTRNYLITDPVNASGLISLFGKLTTGQAYTGAEIQDSLSNIKNILSL